MFITFSKERNISIMRLVTFIISTILGSQLSRVPGVQARRNSLVGRRGAGGRVQEADRGPPSQPQVGGLGGGRDSGHLEAAGDKAIFLLRQAASLPQPQKQGAVCQMVDWACLSFHEADKIR